MKKLIIVLSLGLFSFMGFGLNDTNKSMDLRRNCVNVTLSCGVSGEACVASTAQLLRHIQFAEAYWCD